MMKLINEAHGVVAQTPALGIAQLVHRRAGDAHGAARRQIQAPQQLQQRGLARSGSADDGDALAGADLDVRPAQHLQRHPALHELLDQIHPFQHRIH